MQPVFEIAHLADYRGTRKGAEGGTKLLADLGRFTSVQSNWGSLAWE